MADGGGVLALLVERKVGEGAAHHAAKDVGAILKEELARPSEVGQRASGVRKFDAPRESQI